jgi:hypothetical protein
MCWLSMVSLALVLALSPPGQQGPPLQFESHDALEAWASGSTFGGGRLYRIESDAMELYCADRSHTSGVYSSELALFMGVGDGNYKLALYLPFKRMVQRNVRLQGETLVIQERPQDTTGAGVEMTVPLQMLSGI